MPHPASDVTLHELAVELGATDFELVVICSILGYFGSTGRWRQGSGSRTRITPEQRHEVVANYTRLFAKPDTSAPDPAAAPPFGGQGTETKVAPDSTVTVDESAATESVAPGLGSGLASRGRAASDASESLKTWAEKVADALLAGRDPSGKNLRARVAQAAGVVPLGEWLLRARWGDRNPNTPQTPAEAERIFRKYPLEVVKPIAYQLSEEGALAFAKFKKAGLSGEWRPNHDQFLFAASRVAKSWMRLYNDLRHQGVGDPPEFLQLSEKLAGAFDIQTALPVYSGGSPVLG